MAAKVFQKLELVWIKATQQYEGLGTCLVLRGTVGKAVESGTGDWSSIPCTDVHFSSSFFTGVILIKHASIKKIGAFHLERRESKSKAWVRMNKDRENKDLILSKDIEMNPKADGSHPSTNKA
jgi:hypothetical protein